eukprot:GHVP01024868.1.p1 GENE.GHVP01024868.1~~GHVP01024868.1.p1  ORF type:complete len:1005 (-),score=211.91 GHVP01024868.1:41-2944(-)
MTILDTNILHEEWKIVPPRWTKDTEQRKEGIFSFVDNDSISSLPLEKLSIQTEPEGSKAANPTNIPEKENWAHIVNTDIIPDDYEKAVTNSLDVPFELDPFQKHAIYHIEKGHSVFIAAHTSAGKTLVAEYAIALSLKNTTKAFYTSPIKALSNQKYRDFKEKFDDVGIITGDIQVDPDSSCIVLTTEIFRSMLYRGADILRDVEFVIFDEVHYVNNAERGVVWEEALILLPSHVKLILLSATVPNTFEFADWVGRTKRRDVYIISTAKRPVPIEHFLFVNPIQKLHRIVNSQNNFDNFGFRGALKQTNERSKKEKIPQKDGTMWREILKILKEKTLLPAISFVFSRRKCEEYAEQIIKSDINLGDCENDVNRFLSLAFSRLSADDANLPQIQTARRMLVKGVAVHHSGLLPIIRETVEILFAAGCVKFLFATETFSMGVNMPAKTVIFSEIKKNDGSSIRELFSSEYTQMAGRAGRRGMDSVGTVIIIAQPNDIPSEVAFKRLILGKDGFLKSQFRITYNMLLCLLRNKSIRIEEIIKKSFCENALQREHNIVRKAHKDAIEKLQKTERLSCVYCEIDINLLTEYSNELQETGLMFRDLMKSSKNKTIVPGKALLISLKGIHLAVYLKKEGEKGLFAIFGEDKEESAIEPPLIGSLDIETVKIKIIDFSCILRITEEVITIKDQTPSTLLALIRPATIKIQENFTERIPMTDTFKIDEVLMRRREILKFIGQLQCVICSDLKNHMKKYIEESSLKEIIKESDFLLSEHSLILVPECRRRISLMKKLEYIDDTGNLLLKGRLACEIKTCNEILLTEAVSDNKFGELEPEILLALLSCLICQERNIYLPDIRKDDLNLIKNTFTDRKERIEHLERDFNVPIGNILINPAIFYVVRDWALGDSFSEIVKKTSIQEGSIIRYIARLDEVCREIKKCARIIGNTSLYDKIDQASEMIKRDMCAVTSLYINE